GAVRQQVDQGRRVDGDHRLPSRSFAGPPGPRPRMVVIASPVSAKPSSLKRPRAREIASSTLLRRIMRPPSSSTLRMVPLLRPSASRTALGRVIWPRSATVASIGLFPGAEVWMESTYFKNHTQSGILCRFPAPPATRQGSHAPSHRSFRPMSDSFATRARLDVNGKSYTYASLPQLGERFRPEQR